MKNRSDKVFARGLCGIGFTLPVLHRVLRRNLPRVVAANLTSTRFEWSTNESLQDRTKERVTLQQQSIARDAV